MCTLNRACVETGYMSDSTYMFRNYFPSMIVTRHWYISFSLNLDYPPPSWVMYTYFHIKMYLFELLFYLISLVDKNTKAEQNSGHSNAGFEEVDETRPSKSKGNHSNNITKGGEEITSVQTVPEANGSVCKANGTVCKDYTSAKSADKGKIESNNNSSSTSKVDSAKTNGTVIASERASIENGSVPSGNGSHEKQEILVVDDSGQASGYVDLETVPSPPVDEALPSVGGIGSDSTVEAEEAHSKTDEDQGDDQNVEVKSSDEDVLGTSPAESNTQKGADATFAAAAETDSVKKQDAHQDQTEEDKQDDASGFTIPPIYALQTVEEKEKYYERKLNEETGEVTCEITAAAARAAQTAAQNRQQENNNQLISKDALHQNSTDESLETPQQTSSDDNLETPKQNLHDNRSEETEEQSDEYDLQPNNPESQNEVKEVINARTDSPHQKEEQSASEENEDVDYGKKEKTSNDITQDNQEAEICGKEGEKTDEKLPEVETNDMHNEPAINEVCNDKVSDESAQKDPSVDLPKDELKKMQSKPKDDDDISIVNGQPKKDQQKAANASSKVEDKNEERKAIDSQKAQTIAMLEQIHRQQLEAMQQVPKPKPAPSVNTPKPTAETNRGPANEDIVRYTPPKRNKVNDRWPPQRASLNPTEGSARFSMEEELQRRLTAPGGVGLKTGGGVNRHKGPVKRKSYGGAHS